MSRSRQIQDERWGSLAVLDGIDDGENGGAAVAAAELYAAQTMAAAFEQISTHPAWTVEEAQQWRDRSARALDRLPPASPTHLHLVTGGPR